MDYLPDTALAKVENLREFAGVLALDKWLCNSDGRQVVFCRKSKGASALISLTSAIASTPRNGPSRSAVRGLYANRLVYSGHLRMGNCSTRG